MAWELFKIFFCLLYTLNRRRGFGNQVGEPQAHDPYSNINGPAYFFDIHILFLPLKTVNVVILFLL